MKNKKIISLVMALTMLLTFTLTANAELDLGLKAGSAYLIEQSTGRVLYQQNADVKYAPASVTKVMTMLLVMEALDGGRISLDDEVSVSEHAASMGGSQVYLEVGERMSVHNMLKAVAVASGNDAAVALAEHVYGTEEVFVEKMNQRARELGMNDTHFVNCNGLDEEGHLTTAHDIALMSAELLKHPKILEYTGIWMDTLRNGEFGISNTNKLIRFYKGANGLKTGSTSTAKYCLSASALRNNMQLIAVVMCAPTSDDRFASAKKLLDYGFSNYAIAALPQEELPLLTVHSGVAPTVELEHAPFTALVGKGSESRVEKKVELTDMVKAPVEAGQKMGIIRYYLDGEEIGSSDIVAKTAVERISIWGLFAKMLRRMS